jgi:hypothetical protein
MNLEAFYDESPARRESREVSFGEAWSVEGEPGTRSVFWVEATGELVSFHRQSSAFPDSGSTPSFAKDVYDALSIFWEGHRGDVTEVEILFIEPNLRQVEAWLSGWEQRQYEADSYGWLRRHLEIAAATRTRSGHQSPPAQA